MATLKNGFSLERYQMLRQLLPWDSITAKDLKGAANTVLATFYVPASYGSIDLKRMGFIGAVAGGAQTTAGTMKLRINGTDVTDADLAVFVCSSVVSHTAGSVVETSLDKQTNADELSTTPPVYPAAVAGDVITCCVGTQGVGAGDQTVFPYLLYSETPGQA